jgi:hypothetical protein
MGDSGPAVGPDGDQAAARSHASERAHRTTAQAKVAAAPNGMAVLVGPTAGRCVLGAAAGVAVAVALHGGRLVVAAAGDGLAGLEEDGDEHVVAAEGEVVGFHGVHRGACE